MTKKEVHNTERAVKIGFIFYTIALLITSICAYFIDFKFNIFLVILISGLLVFFISDFLLNKFL